MIRLDLVTLIIREEDDTVVGFGIHYPAFTCHAKGKRTFISFRLDTPAESIENKAQSNRFVSDGSIA